MNANIRAILEVSANTYSDMIEKVGQDVDELWENGNWTLVSAIAEPSMISNGRPVSWRWNVEVEWKGLTRA